MTVKLFNTMKYNESYIKEYNSVIQFCNIGLAIIFSSLCSQRSARSVALNINAGKIVEQKKHYLIFCSIVLYLCAKHKVNQSETFLTYIK